MYLTLQKRCSFGLLFFLIFFVSTQYIGICSSYNQEITRQECSFSLQIPFKIFIGAYILYCAINAGLLVVHWIEKSERPCNLNFDTLLSSLVIGLCSLQIIFFVIGSFAVIYIYG